MKNSVTLLTFSKINISLAVEVAQKNKSETKIDVERQSQFVATNSWNVRFLLSYVCSAACHKKYEKITRMTSARKNCEKSEIEMQEAKPTNGFSFNLNRF